MRSRESRLRARAYRASRRRGPSLPEDRIRPMRTLRFALISVILAAAVVVPSLAAAATTPIATTPAPVPTTTTARTDAAPSATGAGGREDRSGDPARVRQAAVRRRRLAHGRPRDRDPLRRRTEGQGELLQGRAQGRSENGQRAAAGQRRGPVPHRLRELQRRSREGRRGALRHAAAGGVRRALGKRALRLTRPVRRRSRPLRAPAAVRAERDALRRAAQRRPSTKRPAAP